MIFGRTLRRPAFALTVAALLAATGLGGCLGPTTHTTVRQPPDTAVSAAPAEPGDVSRAEAAADLHQLIDTIVAVHPNPYFRQSKDDLLARLDRTLAALPSSESRVAFFRRAARLVASIGDAHTTLPPYLEEIDDYTGDGGRLFPLVLRFADADPVVEVDLDASGAVPLGAIVDDIDGRPISALVDEIGPMVSTETLALRRSFIAEDLREWLWIDGLRPPYRVGYHVAGGARRDVSLDGATSTAIGDWEDSPAGKRYADPAHFAMLRDGVGDLTLHDFDNADGAFDKLLPKLFHEIAVAAPRALLIDVRENDGGTTDTVSDIIDYLTTSPFRIESRDDTKSSAIVKRSLGKKKYVDLYDERAWNAADGEVVSESIDPDGPDDVANRYAGHVYVLEGPGTFSSAAIFASAVQDAKLGEILGETSGGLPTLYANAYDFTLAKTGIDASASTDYTVRPDGDETETGVAPDHVLAHTSELANDTELDRAVDLIDAELGEPSETRAP